MIPITFGNRYGFTQLQSLTGRIQKQAELEKNQVEYVVTKEQDSVKGEVWMIHTNEWGTKDLSNALKKHSTHGGKFFLHWTP